MLVRVKVIGGGAKEDPIRVPFPTYRMVEASPSGGKIIVEIPDADMPAELVPASIEEKAILGGKEVVVNLAPGKLAKLYGHLDKRYKEHAGRFRPELV